MTNTTLDVSIMDGASFFPTESAPANPDFMTINYNQAVKAASDLDAKNLGYFKDVAVPEWISKATYATIHNQPIPDKPIAKNGHTVYIKEAAGGTWIATVEVGPLAVCPDLPVVPPPPPGITGLTTQDKEQSQTVDQKIDSLHGLLLGIKADIALLKTKAGV
jgi:hypothetical protein